MKTTVATAALLLLMFVVPFFAVSHLFYRFVDRPACTAECRTTGMAFESYRYLKSGSLCVCRGPEGTVSRRASYTVTGQQGTFHALLDVLIRIAAPLGGVALSTAGILAVLRPLSPHLRQWIGR